jgi:hypothetical protein
MPPRSARRISGARGGGSTVLAVVLVIIVLFVAAIGYLTVRPYFAKHKAPASNAPFSGEIDIVPAAGTAPGCVVATPGSGIPTKGLANGSLEANTFNVPSGTAGSVGLCYNAETGSVLNYVNWSSVGGAGGWFTYPEISYGVQSWGGSATTYTPQSSHWSLPATVDSVVGSNAWGTVSYTYHPPNPSVARGNDYSFDDFLTETRPPVFEQGPFIEVMVWFYHNQLYPISFSQWSMPTLVDGSLSNQRWDVGYWCHGPHNGTSPLLTFDFAFRGDSSTGMTAGTVGVDLSLVLAHVEQLMPAVSCWSGPTGGFSQFYLDQMNLGSEETVNGSVALNYNWTESSYCLHLLTQPPTAAAVSCGRPA